jgi:tetratricopeptide (TPR) repeat protein
VDEGRTGADGTTAGQATQMVRMLLGARRYDDAVDAARRALVERPDDSTLLVLLSTAFVHTGRGDEAVDAAQRAIAADPGLAVAHGALGDAHLLGTERWHHAVDAYSRAIAIDPHESSYFTGRAQATLHYVPDGTPIRRRSSGTEAMASARADAMRALALEPDSALPHVVYAKVELSARNPIGARQAAEHALRIDPNSAIALQVRGIALQQLGDIEGASQSFVDAAREDPRSDAPIRLLRNVKVSIPLAIVAAVFGVRVVVGIAAATGFSEVAAGVAAVVVLLATAAWYAVRRRRLRRRMIPAARAALAHDRRIRVRSNRRARRA